MSVARDTEVENLIPADERQRLAAVRRYDILDTPPDGAFDRITALAARLFDVPISIVSIVDQDRIWFKSHHGLTVTEIGRDRGLCASAILHDDPRILPDARADVHAFANPLVAGEFGLRFYAGVPLRTHDGYNLGTLCVIDKEPREVSTGEIAHLEDLASVVMDQMELRLSARAAIAKGIKLAEKNAESEQHFRALAESMAQKMFTAASTGEVEYYNPPWTAFTGQTFEQIRGWGWTQLVHPDDLEENVRLWKHSIDTGEPFQCEHRIRRADGAYRWHLSRAEAMRDSSGKISKWIGSNTEIHEQKTREETARSAASYAELMAHEIDHRVMNSLQFVSSLLSMQGSRTANQQAADELRIAANRVAAVARVHRHFYQDEEAETVLCLDFLKRLSADLSDILQERINVEGTEITVPTRRILPIGLLLNELVTNAAKHGAGTIQVSFDRGADGNCALRVTDEGMGLAANFDPANPGNGLGMKVVGALTKQLEGELFAGPNPTGRGACFTVIFPVGAASGA